MKMPWYPSSDVTSYPTFYDATMARSQENLSSWPVAMASHLSALADPTFEARLAGKVPGKVPGKISDPRR